MIEDAGFRGPEDTSAGDAMSEDGARASATWRAVVVLGVAGAAAAVLPVLAAASWTEGGAGDGTRVVAAAIALAGLVVAVPVLAVARRSTGRMRFRLRPAALAAVVAADVVAMFALTRVLPFRPGVLSCLLYAVPALLVAAVALVRSRRVLLVTAAGLAFLFALTVPVRALQEHVAAREWAGTSGVPSRAVAQVVRFPGLTQERFVWDGTTLTAMFAMPVGPGEAWLAAETVHAGYADPCGPVLTGEGDGSALRTPPCVREAPGLWYRGTADEAVGYVRQRGGVTVTVTGGVRPAAGLSAVAEAAADRAELRRVVLAAHTANDRELWSRARPTRVTLLGALLS